MPIVLHQFLMIVTSFVGFFVCGFVVVFARKDALVAAGVPEWLVWTAPLLAFFASPLLFRFIPASCPGCRWPVAFLRLSEQLMYRCARCRHIHLTVWRGGKTYGPEYTRVWLPPLRLIELNQQQRVTLSGRLHRPCTLLLLITPVEPHAKSELNITVEASLTNEHGETLLRVEGTLKEWDSEPWCLTLRPTLGLRHPEWRDVAIRGVDRLALEIRVDNSGSDGQFRTLRPALEFLHGGPASRFVGPHGEQDRTAVTY